MLIELDNKALESFQQVQSHLVVVLDGAFRLLHCQRLLEAVPVPEGANEVKLHALSLSH